MHPVKTLFLLAVLTLSAFGAVSHVETSPGVTAEWLTPEKDWDGRAVLVLHGLADDKDGPNDITKRLVQTLADHGIATLRINFRGEGDRKRTHIESTFATRIEDGLAAAAFLATLPGVNDKRLGVLGFSLGSSTAMAVGAKEPTRFKTMALLVAPSGDLFQCMTSGNEMQKAYQEAQKKGWGLVEAGWKNYDLSLAYFESFKGYHSSALLDAYPGAFLSIRGSEDFLPQAEADFLKHSKGRPAEALLIGGANHIFNTFEPNLGYEKRLNDALVDWFGRTL